MNINKSVQLNQAAAAAHSVPFKANKQAKVNAAPKNINKVAKTAKFNKMA